MMCTVRFEEVEFLFPLDILFTQDSIRPYFRNGKSLRNTVRAYCDGRDVLPSGCLLTVIFHEGFYWSLNNRSLWVYQELERKGVCGSIPVKLLPKSKVPAWRYYFTTKNNGESVQFRDSLLIHKYEDEVQDNDVPKTEVSVTPALRESHVSEIDLVNALHQPVCQSSSKRNVAVDQSIMIEVKGKKTPKKSSSAQINNGISQRNNGISQRNNGISQKCLKMRKRKRTKFKKSKNKKKMYPTLHQSFVKGKPILNWDAIDGGLTNVSMHSEKERFDCLSKAYSSANSFTSRYDCFTDISDNECSNYHKDEKDGQLRKLADFQHEHCYSDENEQDRNHRNPLNFQHENGNSYKELDRPPRNSSDFQNGKSYSKEKERPYPNSSDFQNGNFYKENDRPHRNSSDFQHENGNSYSKEKDRPHRKSSDFQNGNSYKEKDRLHRNSSDVQHENGNSYKEKDRPYQNSSDFQHENGNSFKEKDRPHQISSDFQNANSYNKEKDRPHPTRSDLQHENGNSYKKNDRPYQNSSDFQHENGNSYKEKDRPHRKSCDITHENGNFYDCEKDGSLLEMYNFQRENGNCYYKEKERPLQTSTDFKREHVNSDEEDGCPWYPPRDENGNFCKIDKAPKRKSSKRHARKRKDFLGEDLRSKIPKKVKCNETHAGKDYSAYQMTSPSFWDEDLKIREILLNEYSKDANDYVTGESNSYSLNDKKDGHRRYLGNCKDGNCNYENDEIEDSIEYHDQCFLKKRKGRKRKHVLREDLRSKIPRKLESQKTPVRNNYSSTNQMSQSFEEEDSKIRQIFLMERFRNKNRDDKMESNSHSLDDKKDGRGQYLGKDENCNYENGEIEDSIEYHDQRFLKKRKGRKRKHVLREDLRSKIPRKGQSSETNSSTNQMSQNIEEEDSKIRKILLMENSRNENHNDANGNKDFTVDLKDTNTKYKSSSNKRAAPNFIWNSCFKDLNTKLSVSRTRENAGNERRKTQNEISICQKVLWDECGTRISTCVSMEENYRPAPQRRMTQHGLDSSLIDSSFIKTLPPAEMLMEDAKCLKSHDGSQNHFTQRDASDMKLYTDSEDRTEFLNEKGEPNSIASWERNFKAFKEFFSPNVQKSLSHLTNSDFPSTQPYKVTERSPGLAQTSQKDLQTIAADNGTRVSYENNSLSLTSDKVTSRAFGIDSAQITSGFFPPSLIRTNVPQTTLPQLIPTSYPLSWPPSFHQQFWWDMALSLAWRPPSLFLPVNVTHMTGRQSDVVNIPTLSSLSLRRNSASSSPQGQLQINPFPQPVVPKLSLIPFETPNMVDKPEK